MAVYSINDLEQLSGIKAHTIRIWEKRYSIISPKRTATNIRYYQDEDLKHILNVAILNRNGFKISKIAAMNKVTIDREAAQIANVHFCQDDLIDALTLGLIELDERKFHRVIDSNIEQNGFEKTMLDVVYPMLNKLSMLWMTGSIKPVHENFMMMMIRQKIIVAIDSAHRCHSLSPHKFMIYMPEDEAQELNFLFLDYLIATRKHRVINLGSNINVGDLEEAYRMQRPGYMFVVISENKSIVLQDYLQTLSDRFPEATILVTGYQVVAQNIQPPENVVILSSMSETVNFLDGLKNADGSSDNCKCET